MAEKKPTKSTTSKTKEDASTPKTRVEEKAPAVVIDWSNWREIIFGTRVEPRPTQLGAIPVFTEEKKTRYLEHLERYGYCSLAARSVGIILGTVENNRAHDPEFAQAEKMALKLRGDRLASRLEAEAIEGSVSTTFDKDGNVLNERRVYESNLRSLVLRRYGDAYIEKSEVDITSGGQPIGAVVVPAGLTVEQWKAQYDNQQNLDTTPTPKD